MLKLSKKGTDLIKYYKRMAKEGYDRIDGIKVQSAYNDFELQKFRNVVRHNMQQEEIKTVLDYGGGGSDWDAINFDPVTGKSAKEFFNLEEVNTFEPARSLLKKVESDCVVCVDVLEHIFVADIATVVKDLFKLSKKLLVINVACYKDAALLPNGENAHVTVRNPHWWKGVVDTIALDYKDVEVMLICSTTFSSGIIFKTFKVSEWYSASKFSIDVEGAMFSPT